MNENPSRETSPKSPAIGSQVPEYLFPLFWDCDPKTLHLDDDAEFLMGRIMERGTWEAMRWLLKVYPRERLASFLENRGKRMLPPRELCFWSLIVGISPEKRADWVNESRRRRTTWSTRYAHGSPQ